MCLLILRNSNKIPLTYLMRKEDNVFSGPIWFFNSYLGNAPHLFFIYINKQTIRPGVTIWQFEGHMRTVWKVLRKLTKFTVASNIASTRINILLNNWLLYIYLCRIINFELFYCSFKNNFFNKYIINVLFFCFHLKHAHTHTHTYPPPANS